VPLEVKICGLTRREDAEAAAAAGADYAGVILAPGYRRSVLPAAAAEILGSLPLRRVGVFVDAGLEEIRAAAERAGLDVVQLHGFEPPALARALREEGRWRVWKALRPRSVAEFVAEVERYAGVVDALLVDGWSERAAGGTGTAFEWEEIARQREALGETALVVAGGLSAENVARAVRLLRPAAVDVSSGVERSPGAKDAAAVAQFVAAARGALAQ
jgi:phosphoribosylanthranilate isomerase